MLRCVALHIYSYRLRGQQVLPRALPVTRPRMLRENASPKRIREQFPRLLTRLALLSLVHRAFFLGRPCRIFLCFFCGLVGMRIGFFSRREQKNGRFVATFTRFQPKTMIHMVEIWKRRFGTYLVKLTGRIMINFSKLERHTFFRWTRRHFLVARSFCTYVFFVSVDLRHFVSGRGEGSGQSLFVSEACVCTHVCAPFFRVFLRRLNSSWCCRGRSCCRVVNVLQEDT